jgi:hypothetical protein
MARRNPSYRRILLIAVGLVAILILRHYMGVRPATDPGIPPTGGTVEYLSERNLSGVMVGAAGHVTRILPDDNEGSRHQRFILKLASGHTVLISHNIDLAPRVPLSKGDHVAVFGQYEWNERGGVLHWTHHDPAGRHEEGWIEHDGRRYQ